MRAEGQFSMRFRKVLFGTAHWNRCSSGLAAEICRGYIVWGFLILFLSAVFVRCFENLIPTSSRYFFSLRRIEWIYSTYALVGVWLGIRGLFAHGEETQEDEEDGLSRRIGDRRSNPARAVDAAEPEPRERSKRIWPGVILIVHLSLILWIIGSSTRKGLWPGATGSIFRNGSN